MEDTAVLEEVMAVLVVVSEEKDLEVATEEVMEEVLEEVMEEDTAVVLRSSK